MNYRYFIPFDPPNDRLARVDTDHGAAQLLIEGQQDWLPTNSLLRITLTDDNLDWEEISASKAAEIERRLAR